MWLQGNIDVEFLKEESIPLSEALSQDVLCETINGWACVNVYVTQFSQVSHLRGNALVSLRAALTVIRTLAKNHPGGEGQGKQHCCLGGP